MSHDGDEAIAASVRYALERADRFRDERDAAIARAEKAEAELAELKIGAGIPACAFGIGEFVRFMGGKRVVQGRFMGESGWEYRVASTDGKMRWTVTESDLIAENHEGCDDD